MILWMNKLNLEPSGNKITETVKPALSTTCVQWSLWFKLNVCWFAKQSETTSIHISDANGCFKHILAIVYSFGILGNVPF